MTEDERESVKTYLAANPKAGVVVPGMGGLRKLRWAGRGKGKRGGVRVIYYFHDRSMPIFLIAAYAKSEKADISGWERSQWKDLGKRLVESYRSRGPKQ